MGPCFIILLFIRFRTTFLLPFFFLFVLTESFNVFYINGLYMLELSILFEKFPRTAYLMVLRFQHVNSPLVRCRGYKID